MAQPWWKEAVVYQIYPRSFCDGNGDGIGDLRGIFSKLDYLKELGVDVVWLSPVYKSPMDDMGYDISDYRDIAPEYGTLADFREMLAGMHARGIKLVMDLVVNHTSDEHPWFIQARASKDNPYRDYYIWRPPKPDGSEPNNWLAHFGGSAWQLDPTTGEYYLHLFSKKQPDLNWENPAVRREVYDMMHWWLRQGVDGFRMDVINMISKAPGLPDAPVTGPGPYQWGGEYFTNGPKMLEWLVEMRKEVLSHYDTLTVGETPNVATTHAVQITNEESGPLNMLFQFEHMDIDREWGNPTGLKPWQLSELKAITTRWQRDLAAGRGWNSNYLSNHDQPRPVSRFGNDKEYRVESAKLLGTFLHMLQGTPYVYEGEEIGMTNVAFPSIDDYRDIATLNMYHEAVEGGVDPAFALQVVHLRSRDNARTPMQWDASANAGFTTGTPWIKVNPNYTEINVEAAKADRNSVFHYYQRLIELRHTLPVVAHGVYDLLLPDHAQIYAFTRTYEDAKLLVILNFSGEQPAFELPAGFAGSRGDLVIANYPVEGAGGRADTDLSRITLRPWEARVYAVS